MKQMFSFMLFLLCVSFAAHAQQWEVVLPDSVHIASGLIEQDNTSYYVGFSQNENSWANGAFVKVYDDGQYELKIYNEQGEKHLSFESLISLPNGNILVTGKRSSGGTYEPGELVVLVLDDALNIISEHSYQVAEGFQGFLKSSAIIDDDETIVVFAIARRQNPYVPETLQFIGVLFRFTQEAECLHCCYLTAEPPAPLCYINQITSLQLINNPNNSNTIVLGPGRGGMESIMHFDYNFNLLDDYIIEDLSVPEMNIGRDVMDQCSYYWYNGNDMLLVGTQRDTVIHNKPHILIGHMNLEGKITAKIEINKQDSLMYCSQNRKDMACANDSTIFIISRCYTVDWYEPFYPQIYLINNELELLGCISFWDDVDYWPIMILPTSDDGCICVTKPYGLFYDVTPPKICRFSREDFNPVWSIKERPKQEILSSVYPNPAKDEIHFDLTEVPMDGSVRLCIMNTCGKTYIDRIIRGSGNLLTVGIETLPSGVYTYSFYDKGKTLFSGKFLKD